jgi:putative peptide zinc metalloprotease protein
VDLASQASSRFHDDEKGGLHGHPSSVFPDPPRLATGVELIGRYEGSGLEKPIYLARRGDGRVIQMSHLIYCVVRYIDGSRSLELIASEAGTELGRSLRAEDVTFLIENKLRPSRLVATPGDTSAVTRTDQPILGLKIKSRVLPAGLVNAITKLTLPLFNPVILLEVLVGLAIFDRWLLFDHGMARATQQLLDHPTLAFAILGLVVAATAFHELGHATACRYGGARPGGIGVGLYLAWPVFYSDVTDSYRLNRIGRLRTDLGGVFFNLVAASVMTGAYLATHFEPLVLAIVLVQVDALHQFFPFARLDGYYVASDLIGVPDLFLRMRPMLASVIPGRPMHPLVKGLKPWARYAVATWVYLTFVVIIGLYVLLIKAMPRVLATAYQSFMTHLVEIGYFAHHGRPGYAALAVLDELSLAFPLIALALTVLIVIRKLLRLWARMEMRPTFRVATAVASVVILVMALPTLSAPRNYRPIQPSDRGTLPAPSTGGQQASIPGGGWLLPNASASARATPSAAPSAAAGQATQPPPPSSASSSGGSSPAPSPSPSPAPPPSSPPSPSPSPSPLPSPT